MTLRTELERRPPTARLLDWFDWMENEFGQAAGLHLPAFERTMRCEDFVEDDRYVLRAELAGVDPDKDVQVTVADGVLTIAAERTEEKKDRGRSEFYYGALRRSVTLPEGADGTAVKATYKDGILEVTVPITSGTTPKTTVPIERAT
jgi:HSP20 family molecular chaperone IbpA